MVFGVTGVGEVKDLFAGVFGDLFDEVAIGVIGGFPPSGVAFAFGFIHHGELVAVARAAGLIVSDIPRW